MIPDSTETGRHPGLDSPEADEIQGRVSGPEKPHAPAHWHILAAVLGATFVAYARTLSFEFVHDDFLQLVNNPAIHSWRYLPRYFTENVWAGVYPGIPGNYYRPLFLLWCRLNDAMFGDQAGLWHLTTVATHLLTTALVYFLVLRLAGDRLTAGIAGLVFGLHPVHIEAVAWVSGVTEPLLGVFFIGAFLGYLKYREGGRRAGAWMAFALCLYVLGMLEKETAVILPAIICVYEWLYGDVPAGDHPWSIRFLRARRAVRGAAPFVLLTLPYLVGRVAALKGFSHRFADFTAAEVFFTWPSLIWFWMRHLVVPVGLGTFYDLRAVEHPGLMNFVLPAGAVALIGVALGWGARRSREVAFAALWISLPLVPLLDIRVFLRNDFAHDRYLYLPSAGFAIIVALAVRSLPPGRLNVFGFPVRQGFPLLALVLTLGFGTWFESFYFENNWVFYRYNYLLSPGNAYVANNYGAILARLGMREESIKVLKRADDENPGYWSLAYNLGLNYYRTGQRELAERYLLRATQIDPTDPNAFFCLGLTELDAGNVKWAEQAFRSAIKINPQGEGYHYDLGLALQEQGDLDGALAQFQAELSVNPRHADARRQAREIQEGRAETLPNQLPGLRPPRHFGSPELPR